MYNILPVPIVWRLKAVNGSVMCKIPASSALSTAGVYALPASHRPNPNVVSRWYRAQCKRGRGTRAVSIHFVSLRHFGTHEHKDVGYGRLASSGAVTCIPL
jgi:hypothetical protein